MNLGYYQLLLSQHCDLHQRDMPNQSTPTSAPYTLSVSACARVCLLIGAWDGEGGVVGQQAGKKERKMWKCAYKRDGELHVYINSIIALCRLCFIIETQSPLPVGSPCRWTTPGTLLQTLLAITGLFIAGPCRWTTY